MSERIRTAEPTSTHIRTFKDWRFTVVAKAFSHYVEFQVYQIEYFEDEGTPEERPLWHKAGSPMSPDPVATLEESAPYLHGSVKWDTCSNWFFDEQAHGVYLHACSRDDIARWSAVMTACYDWASELMESWDGDDEKQTHVIQPA